VNGGKPYFVTATESKGLRMTIRIVKHPPKADLVDFLTATDSCPRIATLVDNAFQIKGDNLMATYVVFFGYTEQGIRNIKDSPARVEAAKKTFQDMGARVKAFYLVMGMDRYDTMFIVEAPDDETIARASLKVGSLGNVRTDSHRAFSEDEFKKIVSRL
jgi:uncharacterized protein with GYD domain